MHYTYEKPSLRLWFCIFLSYPDFSGYFVVVVVVLKTNILFYKKRPHTKKKDANRFPANVGIGIARSIETAKKPNLPASLSLALFLLGVGE